MTSNQRNTVIVAAILACACTSPSPPHAEQSPQPVSSVTPANRGGDWLPPPQPALTSWTYAADRTNAARARFQTARRLKHDVVAQRSLIELSVREYRVAATAWADVVPTSPKEAEDRAFWAADALYWIVVLQVPTGRAPTTEEIDAAHRSARAVLYARDGAGRYRQACAYYLVNMADTLLNLPPDPASPRSPGPAARVREAVAARDEYVRANPVAPDVPGIGALGPDGDPGDHVNLYAYQAAALLLATGAPEEAIPRLRQIHATECGRTAWGEKARQDLLRIGAPDEPPAHSLRSPCPAVAPPGGP